VHRPGPLIGRPGWAGSSAAGLQAAATAGSAGPEPVWAVRDPDADVASEGERSLRRGEDNAAVLGLATALGRLALPG